MVSLSFIYSRVIVIVGSSNLKAANIKKGVKIFNVTGTWTGWVDSTVTLYNRSNKFNSVANMKYFGSLNGSPHIYPEFNTTMGVWCLQLWRLRSGSWWYGHLWLWFYDQIGKVPAANVIEPWFWALDVGGTTYDTIETWGGGGSPLMIVHYVGTTDSVSTIQSRFNDDVGGSLTSGRPTFYTYNQDDRMVVNWYVPNEIPKQPGYTTKLTSRTTNTNTRYTWTGMVQIDNGWTLGVTSSRAYFDRIDYHPVK